MGRVVPTPATISIRYTDISGVRQQLRIEITADGSGTWFEESDRGGRWRQIGRKNPEDVEVEIGIEGLVANGETQTGI